MEKILVGADGSLTLEVKSEGLLGAQMTIAETGCQETDSMPERTTQSDTVRLLKVICEG